MKTFNFHAFFRNKIIFIILFLVSINIYPKSDSIQAFHYHHIADSLYDIGLYNESTNQYLKAATIYSENKLWKQYIIILKDIGYVFAIQAEYKKSFSLLDSALDLADQLLDKESMVFGLIFNAYGIAYSELGNFEKALYFYDKNLNVTLKHFKPDDYSVALVYNNLGVVYFNKGDYYEALKYYERASYIIKRHYGENHIILAYSYNNIAGVYQVLHDYEHALQMYEMAFKIVTQIKGNINRESASIMHNISIIHFEKHEFNESLKYNKSAIEIKVSLYGDDHHFIGNSYFNLANIYCQEIFSGYNPDSARYYYFKTLKIYQNNFGQINPDVASIYLMLANLEKKLKKYQQAMLYHLEVEKTLCGTVFDHSYVNKNYLIKTISDIHLLDNFEEKGDLYFQLYKNQ